MTENAPRRPRRRALSPITKRILIVNVLALAILVFGVLYLGEYRRSLIATELNDLLIQADVSAAALGEGAVVGDGDRHQLNPVAAGLMVRRLAEATGTRARLFAADGALVADSRRLLGPGGTIEIEELPPPTAATPDWQDGMSAVLDVYDWLAVRLFGGVETLPYAEAPRQQAHDYEEAAQALSGEAASALRASEAKGLVLSVAVPVQRYKQVLGALMLTRGAADIDAAVLEVRLDILAVFAVALGITVLLSIYLAGTIARPIRRLAAAADHIRRGLHRHHNLPDFSGRNDEIGDLAIALRDMTEALWQRMDAIERFAADVAHEIKNPLTSLHSAVETAVRVQDAEQQRKLMTIIEEDVQRLNRLISDISDASRLDAELSRAETAPIDVGSMLATLVDVHEGPAAKQSVHLRLERLAGDDLVVTGLEDRLVQVFRNLITNAVSFSPPGGTITLRTTRDADTVQIEVDDDGPGIPAGKERAIFDRFYSERPQGEKFGTHSGLGLSISKQIVEAHGGTIAARNRRDIGDAETGTRFTVRLPAAAATDKESGR